MTRHPFGYHVWRRELPTIGRIFLHPGRTLRARVAVLGKHCVVITSARFLQRA